MDLKQLQYFVVCAQTGSFSDAAKVLYRGRKCIDMRAGSQMR